MSWTLVYTKQAQKDAKKLTAAGLKSKAVVLLDILRIDPFQNPLTKNLSATSVARIHDASTSSTGWYIKL